MIGKALAVLALVTLPLSVSLWHKSHHEPEQFRFDVTLYKSLRVYLKDGICSLRLLNLPTKTASRTDFRASLNYNATPGSRSFVLQSARNGSYRITWLVFPLWFSTGTLTLIGSVPIVRGPVRQWWRRRRGRCEECGYNLRGNRTGRCPECGEYCRRPARPRSHRQSSSRYVRTSLASKKPHVARLRRTDGRAGDSK